MKRKISDKRLFYIAIAALAAILIPLLAASFHISPSGDDFSYGCVPHNVFVQTRSVWQAFLSAVRQVGNVYKTWQGTYSAVLLFSLQPAVFGERLYSLTGFIMLGALTAGTFALCISLFKRVFAVDGYAGGIAAAAVTVVCTQQLPSPVYAFFWYNGAVYYTFFYGLSLMAFALGIRYLSVGRKCCGLWLSIICLVLGGGNYVTALTCAIVAFSSIALLALLKDKRWRKLVLPAFILMLGFAVNIIAPGNAVRQASVGEHSSAVKAVLMSFARCAQFGVKWFSLPLIGMLVLIAPVLWQSAAASPFRFRFPLTVTAYSYCLLSAMFCPSIYALNSVGPLRLQNIIYFAFVLTVTLNLYYWLGYIAGKCNAKAAGISVGSIAAGAAVYCICCLTAAVTNVGFTSIMALNTVRRGEAAAFRECTEARLEIMNDASIDDAVIPGYSVQPYILFHSDITPDPTSWRNEDMAHFYGKNSVVLE